MSLASVRTRTSWSGRRTHEPWGQRESSRNLQWYVFSYLLVHVKSEGGTTWPRTCLDQIWSGSRRVPERKSLLTRDRNCKSSFAKYYLAVSSRYTCNDLKNTLLPLSWQVTEEWTSAEGNTRTMPSSFLFFRTCPEENQATLQIWNTDWGTVQTLHRQHLGIFHR